MRRAQHEALTKTAIRDYHPTFCKEATILASSILKNPKALDQHFKRSSTSAIMSILYDYPTLEDEHDETVTEINALFDRMSAAAAPGAYLVELLPWMIYIPERYAYIPYIVYLKCLSKENPRFARWKREGFEHFRQHTALFNRCLNTVCDDIVSAISCVSEQIFPEKLVLQAKGSERPSVGATLIKNSDRSGLSRDEIAWLLGTL